LFSLCCCTMVTMSSKVIIVVILFCLFATSAMTTHCEFNIIEVFYLVVLQGSQWVSSLLSFNSSSFLLTNMVVSSSKLIIISYFVYNVLQMWWQVLSLTLLCFSFSVVLLLWAQHQQALSHHHQYSQVKSTLGVVVL